MARGSFGGDSGSGVSLDASPGTASIAGNPFDTGLIAPSHSTLSSLGFGDTSSGGSSASPRAVLPSPAKVAPSSSQGQPPPQRFDLNAIMGFNGTAPTALTPSSDLSAPTPGLSDQGAASFIGSLGALPAQTLERPVAAADTVTSGDNLTGLLSSLPIVGSLFGIANQASGGGYGKAIDAQHPQSPVKSIEDTVGRIPVVGPVVGGIGNLMHDISGIIPNAKNTNDAEMLARVNAAHLPDSTPFSPAALGYFGLGLGTLEAAVSNYSTVGEFRAAMAKRGITADMVGQNLADKSTSDSALGDMAFRVASDPSNLLLPVGGPLKAAGAVAEFAGGLKVVDKGIGLFDGLVKAGSVLAKPVDAISSARLGFAEGNAAAATLKGMGTFIQQGLSDVAGKLPEFPSAASVWKGYTATSVATQAGTAAINWTTGELAKNNTIPALTPAFQQIHDLSQAILDDKPLSTNAAFGILAAYHFPLRDVIRDATPPVRAFLNKGGAANAMIDAVAPKDLTFADKKAWVDTNYGGTPGLSKLVGYLDAKIAQNDLFTADMLAKKPALTDRYTNLTDVAARNQQLSTFIEEHAANMRAKGLITNSMRQAMYKDWFSTQSGFGLGSNNPAELIHQTFDPEIAAQHWTNYSNIQAKIGDTLKARGDVVVGLQDTLYREHADQVSMLFDGMAKNGKVAAADVQRVLNQYPQLQATDTTGYFAGKNATNAAAGLRSSPDYSLQSLQAHIRAASKDAPTLGELTHEVAAAEKTAPDAPAMPTGPVTHAGDVVTPNGNGALSPAYADHILGQGDPLRDPTPTQNAPQAPTTAPDAGLPERTPQTPFTANGRWFRTIEDAQAAAGSPRISTPSDPEVAPILHAVDATTLPPDIAQQMPMFDDAALNSLSNSSGLAWGNVNKVPVDEELAQLQRFIQEVSPGYRLKNAPNLAYIGDAPAVAAQVLKQNALAEWLHYSGPFSPLFTAIDLLKSKPTPGSLASDARQAAMNYLIPRGATPKQVATWFDRLRSESTDGPHAIAGVPVFRNSQALLPSAIRAIAEGGKAVGVTGALERIFSEETAAAVQKDFGGWDRLLDQVHNRAFQGLQKTADARLSALGNGSKVGFARDATTGALARAAEKVYTTWQGTLPGQAARIGTKTLYPILRFMADPRWWTTNKFEASGLALTKYGIGSLKNGGPEVPVNATMNQLGALTAKDAAAISNKVVGEDAGLPFGHRQIGAIVTRTFEAKVRQSIDNTLNEIGARNPVHQDLVARFGPDQSTWAQQIYDTLYHFDQKGVKAAISETAAANGLADARLAPFYDKLYDLHSGFMHDIQNLMQGNTTRTNAERVLNHPLLYWPLSYQLKAAKWLFDVATDESFGHQTNFGGAYTLANIEQQHKHQMATNPAYASFFNDHPALWQMASQLVPITPYDLGVSLSRPLRYAGGWLGAWGQYSAAKTPQGAALAIMNLGPMYTAKLLGDIYGQITGNQTVQITVPVKPKSQTTSKKALK